MKRILRGAAVAATGLVLAAGSAVQAAFVVGNVGTQNDNFIVGQGFSPSVQPSPDPSLAAGSTVYLTNFRFNKSLFANGGVMDQVNTRLVVFNQVYPDFNGTDNATPITLASGAVVGISTNTVDTTPLGDGDAISFNFNNLALTYGNNYSAYMVTVGAGDALTPARVSIKSANYVETPPGSGTYLPNPNYGPTGNFNYVALTPPNANGFSGAFGGEGDSNFQATFAVPEPTGIAVGACGAALACGMVRRRRRDS